MSQATKEPGTALAAVAESAAIASPAAAWSPFSLMDRLDAAALVQEMQGVASDVLVYKVKDGGKEVVGLSKAGVDECCTMLVQQGQCIREESINMKMIGEGLEQEAIFECVAARYAVHPDGREVKLDQVIGVKREPLYEERASLTLDSRVPGKRWRGKGENGGDLTYREALDESHPANEGRGEALGYLQWIVDASNFDDATKQFVTLILSGADPNEFAAGKRFNPFWYEHGAMKAARNARFRLIPAEVKASVIALAKQTGKELEQEVPNRPAMQTKRPGSGESMPRRRTTAADRERQSGGVSRRDTKAEPYNWIFAPHVGVPLDAMTGRGANDYVIDDNTLNKGLAFCEKGLSGAEIRKADGSRGTLEPEERDMVVKLKAAIEHELQRRVEYADELRDASSAGAEDRAAAQDARP